MMVLDWQQLDCPNFLKGTYIASSYLNDASIDSGQIFNFMLSSILIMIIALKKKKTARIYKETYICTLVTCAHLFLAPDL